MICPKCGAVLADGSNFCSSCGKNLNGGSASVMSRLAVELDRLTAWVERVVKQGCEMLLRDNPNAPTRLVWNILAAIFLFLPTGLIGCYYSYRVTRAKNENNYSDSIAYSKYAKLWLAVTIAIGAICAPAMWRSVSARNSVVYYDDEGRVERSVQIAPGVWSSRTFETR